MLHAQDEDVLVKDREDDSVLTNTVSAQAGERTRESRETLGMGDQIGVNLIEDMPGFQFADPLEVLCNGFLE